MSRKRGRGLVSVGGQITGDASVAEIYNRPNAMSYGSNQPEWLARMVTVVAETMVINRPTKNLALCRSEKRLQAQNTNYATDGNNIVAFDFPNSKPIDFRTGFLMFDVTLRKTGGTYVRLAQGAWSMIRVLRVYFGSMEDEIQWYNRLYTFLWNSGIAASVQATIGLDLLGVGTTTRRNAWGANANGTSYVIPFYHGMFRQGIVPMNALSTGQNGQLLRVEFTLDNPLNFVETDGTNPQLTITNLRWHYTEVSSADNSFEQEMVRLVTSGQYSIGYETWSVYNNPILSSQPDILIQWKGSALNQITTIFVDGTSLANTTVNNKFTTWLKDSSNGATMLNFQHCVNEIWMPVEAVDTTGNAYRAYMQYLNSMGLWAVDGQGLLYPAPIDIDSFNDTQFMITLDMRSVPVPATDRSERFNTLSTSNSTSNTLLRIQYSSKPIDQTLAFHLVSNNVLLVADRKGTLTKKW